MHTRHSVRSVKHRYVLLRTCHANAITVSNVAKEKSLRLKLSEIIGRCARNKLCPCHDRVDESTGIPGTRDKAMRDNNREKEKDTEKSLSSSAFADQVAKEIRPRRTITKEPSRLTQERVRRSRIALDRDLKIQQRDSPCSLARSADSALTTEEARGTKRMMFCQFYSF